MTEQVVEWAWVTNALNESRHCHYSKQIRFVVSHPLNLGHFGKSSVNVNSSLTEGERGQKEKKKQSLICNVTSKHSLERRHWKWMRHRLCGHASILAIIFSIAPRIDDWHVLHRSVMTLISLKKRNYRNKNSTDKSAHAIIHTRNLAQSLSTQHDPVLTVCQRGSCFLFNGCSNQIGRGGQWATERGK